MRCVVGEPLAVVGQHGADVAEHAVVEELPDHVVASAGRTSTAPRRRTRPRSAAASAICRGLRRVQRERLLDQHVLAAPRARAGAAGGGRCAASRCRRRRPRGRRRARRTTRVRAAMPTRSANSFADATEREPTATTCWRVLRRSEPMNRSAIHPVPSTPQRRAGAAIGSGARGQTGKRRSANSVIRVRPSTPAAVVHRRDDRPRPRRSRPTPSRTGRRAASGRRRRPTSTQACSSSR